MKILLIHPEDDPERGPWTNLPWDRIIDLGQGGENSYAGWNRRFGCPVTTLDSLRNGIDDFRQIRDILGLGCGRLLDEHGLDWWEIMSILLTEEVEALILLQRFARTIGSADEVHFSRPGLHASLLQCLLGAHTKVCSLQTKTRKSGLRHYARVCAKLSAPQLVDVFWDKYDAGYQLRGRFAGKRPPSTRPVVLLPTAYINVSRTDIAYANTFPQENFLLVATRQSGWLGNLPRNVAGAWLSSYASLRARSDENSHMAARWRSFLKALEGVAEFDILKQLGFLDGFPQRFRNGFEVRDAWRNVLDSEPVEGVLCADDSNPYTRIPLLLASARGLPNIACHHGALDGRYVFKRTYGDVIWVKGKMEEDYLVRRCGVPAARIEIAAPALPLESRSKLSLPPNFQKHILFISEPYEAKGGRAEEFYRDILPPLAEVALRSGRELLVKLHPAESKAQRAEMLARILSPLQRASAHLVSGPLTEDLIADAWFGITILSTVASECAIRGIPCFFCTWLESHSYGYIEQFIRFGVGVGLNRPREIEDIPKYLEQHASAGVFDHFWRSVAPQRLRQLMAASAMPCPVAAD
jgi:hypothetical protein